jgi:hypothetical protein
MPASGGVGRAATSAGKPTISASARVGQGRLTPRGLLRGWTLATAVVAVRARSRSPVEERSPAAPELKEVSVASKAREPECHYGRVSQAISPLWSSVATAAARSLCG